MSLMTIFITPKAFDRDHIAVIQWNAIMSWKRLSPDADVILIGDDAGVAEMAAELGVRHAPQVKRNESGTPLLSDIFQIARDQSDSPLLAYVNADILLFPEMLATAKNAMEKEEKFLLVGQRWDMDIRQRLDFSAGWETRLRADMNAHAKRHPAGGSDYFIYPRACFEKIPPFAIGRSGWDNWMFYEARLKNWKLINCTDAIDIIHQNHDYAHLPGGKGHHRLPESNENVRIAGGKRVIFTLQDCNWRMTKDGALKKAPLTKAKFLREAEIFPLTGLKSKTLGELSFALFHPKKAYAEFRTRRKKKA